MVRINLNQKPNDACIKKCNKEARHQITENDLCAKLMSVEDNLPIRCVGDWAEQKIYFLSQYFGIFAEGMKKRWRELNYIEICSGPGRCINRSTGNELDGTALCIIKHKSFENIHKAIFFDFNESVVDILNKRIANTGVKNAKAIIGDYNNPKKLCQDILSEISQNSLNLILIDPTDCSIPFELIRSIKSSLPRVDFIINVATGTDFNRNIPMAFRDPDRAIKYNTFLGTNTFFTNEENINANKIGHYSKLRENFRLTYQDSFKSIGFSHFDIKLVEHYYDILFAAAHPTAIAFWRQATKIKPDGQRSLNF